MANYYIPNYSTILYLFKNFLILLIHWREIISPRDWILKQNGISSTRSDECALHYHRVSNVTPQCPHRLHKTYLLMSLSLQCSRIWSEAFLFLQIPFIVNFPFTFHHGGFVYSRAPGPCWRSLTLTLWFSPQERTVTIRRQAIGGFGLSIKVN